MDDLPLPVNKTVFDEQPIGNTSKLMIDEYPAGIIFVDFRLRSIKARGKKLTFTFGKTSCFKGVESKEVSVRGTIQNCRRRELQRFLRT